MPKDYRDWTSDVLFANRNRAVKTIGGKRRIVPKPEKESVWERKVQPTINEFTKDVFQANRFRKDRAKKLGLMRYRDGAK